MITLINKKLANRKGFTLIELLVVLAVLAIIALIAIPNFIGIQQQSRVKSDVSSADAIARALEMAITQEDLVIADGATVATFTKSGITIDKGVNIKDENLTIGLTDYKVQSDENATITFNVKKGKVVHDAKAENGKLITGTTPAAGGGTGTGGN